MVADPDTPPKADSASLLLVCLFIYMLMLVYLHMYVGPCRDQKSKLDPLGLEL